MKPPNVTPPPPAPPDQVVSAPNMSQQETSPAQAPQATHAISLQQQQQIQQQSLPQQKQQPLQQSQQSSTPVTKASATTMSMPPPTPSLKGTNSLNQTNITNQPIITTQAIVVLKTTSIGPQHEQQAPLALTTQPQNKAVAQTTQSTMLQNIQQQSIVPNVVPATTITLPQQRPTPPPPTIKDSNNLNRTNSVTPQALVTTQANIVAKTSTNNLQQEQQAPLALITQPQSRPTIQTVSSPVPQIQTPVQMPIVAAPTTPKQDPSKQICCLLDQGIRCDRVAGNASFSARIQKIVASKKMNFGLDPNVRHTYICDHHKAVITVAKKSVPTARESKAAARNLAAAAAANNITVNNLGPQHLNNYNELSMNQTGIQRPVNLDLMANQGRMTNNHTGMLISMPIRPGTQIAYSPYPNPGVHPNQLGHPVMTTSSFDNAGGDSLPSGSGGIDVDLQQLQVNTLRRYKRHFRVQTRPGLNKMQLAESLKHHFRTLPIIEKEAITYFVYIVKSSRNKLDHNPKAD